MREDELKILIEQAELRGFKEGYMEGLMVVHESIGMAIKDVAGLIVGSESKEAMQ